MKKEDLMLLFDIRHADQPQNIHYSRFIKNDKNIFMALKHWRAANDDYFDLEDRGVNERNRHSPDSGIDNTGQ